MQVQQFILGMVFKSFLLNPAVPRIIYLVRLNVEKLTQLDQYPIFNFLQGYDREAFVLGVYKTWNCNSLVFKWAINNSSKLA